MLDEEAETEQHGEYGVCLAAEQEEQTVPDSLVAEVQEIALRRGVGKGIEVEMLDGMEQDNGQHREATQHVGGINAPVLTHCRVNMHFVCSHDIIVGLFLLKSLFNNKC